MSGFDYSSRLHFKAAREDFGGGPDLVKRGAAFKFTPPSIGNDVWIGEGVLLARGVKIGDGAVVAARSIVTRDVPPFAVVAGAPATVKKLRFPEHLVDSFIQSQWWRYNFCDFKGVETTQPEVFISQFLEKKAAGAISEYEPEKTAIHELCELHCVGLR